jgi:YD repeat-containing protein
MLVPTTWSNTSGIWSYGFSSYTADGNAVEYLLAGPSNGGATAELDWGELVGGGAGWTQFTVTYNNGERKVFDANFGILLSTADRNGNTTGFSYGGGLLLLAVTDAASRHLYFTYQQILVGQFPVNVVSSVTTDFGVSLSYQYDNLARLVKVTEPDGTFTTFAYTPANLISTVTDTNGKILESHTYDSYGRALTSSQAGGVNAVTLTYSY